MNDEEIMTTLAQGIPDLAAILEKKNVGRNLTRRL